MNRNKVLLVSFSVIIISSIIIFLLYRQVHPLGGINTKLNSSEVREKASAFLNEMGVDFDGFNADVKINSNNLLLKETQKESGLNKTNDLLRKGFPGFYWQVDWRKDQNLVIGKSGGENQVRVESHATVKYDTKGNLLEFTRKLDDSLKYKTISREEAEKISLDFISTNLNGKEFSPDTINRLRSDTASSISFSLGSSGKVSFKEEKKTERGNRTDYEFYYTGTDDIYAGKKVQVAVTVSGDMVTGYKSEYIPEETEASFDYSLYEAIVTILFYIAIFIMIAITAFRRIKAFEIGFRTAIIIGIITALCFGLEIYLNIGNNMGWELLFPLILGPLFYGGAVLLLWGVSETVTRETWGGKFISLDLLTKGYFLHSRVGKSVLMGLAGGVMTAAFLLILVFLADNILPVWFLVDENSLTQFNSPDAALTLINHFIYSSLFAVTIFFIFLVSGLKRRVSVVLLFIIAPVLWGLVNTREIDPLAAAVFIEILIGLLLVWIFYRYDVLTILITVTVFSVVLNGTALFLQDNSSYQNSGYFLASLFFIMILFSVIALFTKDKIQEFQNIAPAFVKNITERERMQRELEIARDVQMSFLPRENPDFPGLAVAGKCLPALEVGGDYYDFIKVGKNTNGVIVGDVSGKGTQAAFYMTLTKGFLKAVSKVSDSPSEVLCQMNELFYENVDRGTFISMIYGIFDTEKRLFRLSRAGHNPVIVKSTGKGKVEMVNPSGLALGLEKGTIFRRTIREVELPLNSGEIYVFYTDGFTEAMNKGKEEYGEERLMRCIELNSGFEPDVIIERVITDVKNFIGKAKQHDDMTIIVVKVK